MNFKKFLTIWFLIPTIIVLNMPKLSSADSFYDVGPGDTHFVAINYLKENGIINGYEDNNFKPYDEINRAEALKMIMLASGTFSEEDFPEVSAAPFTDTPVDAWYTKYLAVAKEKGLISGYDDGTFKPDQNINLAEALKIYLGCFENIAYPELNEDNLFADTPADSWFAKYFAVAKTRELLSIPLTNEAFPDQEIRRGYLAEIIYRMTKFSEEYHFGKATFYGAAVQGSGTASGETFDMNAFTAAHKTLPFGTIVEVTNLANGESVQVKINDRGPYGAGRVIDLSSGAFSEIASLGAGVINVQYKVISES